MDRSGEAILLVVPRGAFHDFFELIRESDFPNFEYTNVAPHLLCSSYNTQTAESRHTQAHMLENRFFGIQRKHTVEPEILHM